MSKYFTININSILANYINYDNNLSFLNALSSFSSPKNSDIERFLKKSSVESAKKGQSATYLVFDEECDMLLGYFSLAIRPISVPTQSLSKTISKKLSRISDYDEITKTHTLSAYLIAQLGKNFAVDPHKMISGTQLLALANENILRLRNLAGGVVQFLECEDNQKLLNFYTTNGFIPFNHRMTKGTSPHKLHQLLKFI